MFKKTLIAAMLAVPVVAFAATADMETEEKKAIIILTQKVMDLEAKMSALESAKAQYDKDKAWAITTYNKDREDYAKDKAEAIRQYMADKEQARKERELLAKGEGKTTGAPNDSLIGNTLSLSSDDGTSFNPKDLYRVVRFTKAYRYEKGNESRPGTRGTFAKDDIVLVSKYGKLRSQVSSGEWIDNKDLVPLVLKKDAQGKYIFKGGFYKTRTYMANARNRTGVNGSEVRAVYYKGSVLWIVEQVKHSDGGTWGKISNGNYINMAIVKKIDF